MLSVAQDGKSDGLTALNETISIFFLVICLVIIPIFMLYFIHHHIDFYQKRKFQNSFGMLGSDLDLRSKWKAAFYFVFCLRRIFFCFIIFGM